MKNLFILLLFVFSGVSFADSPDRILISTTQADINYSIIDPEPAQSLKPFGDYGGDKDSIKDLVWNRYETDNFTILSIDKKQGENLFRNIENIKKDCLSRWGLKDASLSKDCRIMLAPSKELLKRLFGLQSYRIEFRDDVVAIWLDVEDMNLFDNSVREAVTEVCLRDLDPSLSFVAFKGMSELNTSSDNIKNIISRVSETQSGTNFLKVTEKDYQKMNQENKDKFNTDSLVFCLMLKKEFGESKFLEYFFGKNDKICGFDSKSLDSSYNRYYRDIFNELKKDNIPDNYLNIGRK
jgi:hypothetical protein